MVDEAEVTGKLGKVRDYIIQTIQGLNYIPDLSTDQKVMAVREANILAGISWDLDLEPLWAEIIEYVEAGKPLTDGYLLDWRRRVRSTLRIS